MPNISAMDTEKLAIQALNSLGSLFREKSIISNIITEMFYTPQASNDINHPLPAMQQW